MLAADRQARHRLLHRLGGRGGRGREIPSLYILGRVQSLAGARPERLGLVADTLTGEGRQHPGTEIAKTRRAAQRANDT